MYSKVVMAGGWMKVRNGKLGPAGEPLQRVRRFGTQYCTLLWWVGQVPT